MAIPEQEFTFEFIRSSGPGGQNVNKVSTAVRLRFDVRNSAALADEVKLRLLVLAGRRATKEGELVLLGQRHRTQEKNRQHRYGKHVYHLEDFGLSKAAIESQFGFYRNHYRIPHESSRGE